MEKKNRRERKIEKVYYYVEKCGLLTVLFIIVLFSRSVGKRAKRYVRKEYTTPSEKRPTRKLKKRSNVVVPETTSTTKTKNLYPPVTPSIKKSLTAPKNTRISQYNIHNSNTLTKILFITTPTNT